MLTKTTLSGIRALMVLASRGPDPLSPTAIAERIGESPTYMAKVTSRLSRAGLLLSQRGAGGGVRLRLPPSQITLLAVVEACQGNLVPDYCGDQAWHTKTCAFHRAAAELHEAVVGVLTRWTLAALMVNPSGLGVFSQSCRCWTGALPESMRR